MNTLCAPYYVILVGSVAKSFVDMVIFEEMIENAVKNDMLDAGEKKEGIARKRKRRRNQSNFPKNRGYTSYPTYPSHPSYYPSINYHVSTRRVLELDPVFQNPTKNP